MSRVSQLLALCAALPVADAAEGDGVPEWIHLLPAGEIRTVDGRGPYRVVSMHALAGSLKPGERLPIDECHATDRAVPLGQPAPARGWIVALQAREDGLWGQVEWTGKGRELMADRAYCGISPAILHDKNKRVLGVLRASLVNAPNLKGLVALHSEEPGMDWKAKLIELLGLEGEADDEAVMAAISAKMKAPETALQSVVTSPQFVALQTAHSELAEQHNALQDSVARDRSAAFVDAAIAAGRVGLKPVRDTYIALHMSDPTSAETMIGVMPILKGSTHAAGVVPETDDSGLSEGDRQVIALMGLSEDEYRESLKASGKQKEAL